MKVRWFFAGVLITTLGILGCGDDDDVGSGDDDDGGGLSESGAGYSASGATPLAPLTGKPLDSSTGAGDEPIAALDPTRKIIFTANLELSAGDVNRTFSTAMNLARSNGGYVEKSQFSNGRDEDDNRSASMTIRVPVQNYDSLVASLRTIEGSELDNEGSNSTEVTEQYVDLESRLRNLERTEQQYLELLTQATNIQEILTVQDRLSSVRSQIEQVLGRLKVLDNQTEFATVNVSIAPLVARVESKNDWSLQEVLVESWESSLETARYVAAVAVILAVASAWLVIPVGLALFAMRRYRRKPGGAVPLAENS